MGRTAINVNDSILSGTLTARVLNKLNINEYNDKSRTFEDDQLAI